MKKVSLIMLFGLASVIFGNSGTAAQQSATENAQAGVTEVPLMDRVKSYYQSLLKGDRLSALELVMPTSKNQFLNSRFDNLVAFRIVNYEFDSTRDKATIKVVRATRVPKFGQTLDLEYNDLWQRVNGQWYIVLPIADEMDTPFGKMKINTEATPGDPDSEAMKHRIQQTYKNVDPEQYLRALQKVARKPEAAQPKPDDKQKRPETTPAPREDKPKPQS